MATILSLTAITMERAWVIFCITRAKQHRIPMTRMMVLVVSMWITALAVSMAPLLGWNRYIYEVGWHIIKNDNLKSIYENYSWHSLQGYLYSSTVDYLTTLQPDLSYTWLLMLLGWLLPNVLIIMSHATVVWVYRWEDVYDCWIWIIWIYDSRKNNCDLLQAMKEKARNNSTKNYKRQRLMVRNCVTVRKKLSALFSSLRGNYGEPAFFCCFSGQYPGHLMH